MKLKKCFFNVAAAVFTLVFAFSSAAVAQDKIVVTPTNEQGWARTDMTEGGTVDFVSDPTAPSGAGALELTTNDTNEARAKYMHEANIPLAEVTDLGYYTYQVYASFEDGGPSYQLPVLLNGDSGFTTFVYEPYWNGDVVPNTWQYWDVDEGLFWSTKTVTCSNGTITGSSGGPATYTLDQIKSTCPEAIVTGFGVGVGTYNPAYKVRTDLFNFNGTIYDFEPFAVAASKSQCKNNGFADLRRADGSYFRNQGDCIQYVNTGK